LIFPFIFVVLKRCGQVPSRGVTARHQGWARQQLVTDWELPHKAETSPVWQQTELRDDDIGQEMQASARTTSDDAANVLSAANANPFVLPLRE
jgi:hypothetical protein